LLENSISTPSLRKAVTGTGLFMLVLLLGGIVNFLIGKLVSGSGLAGTDRAIGGVFGIVRGAVLIIILMLLAALTPMPQDAWWRDSRFIPQLEPYALWVRNLLPAEIARHFEFAPAATT
ncbi:MAG: CvpA family protein, partial [Nevskiales bacterium]